MPCILTPICTTVTLFTSNRPYRQDRLFYPTMEFQRRLLESFKSLIQFVVKFLDLSITGTHVYTRENYLLHVKEFSQPSGYVSLACLHFLFPPCAAVPDLRVEKAHNIWHGRRTRLTVASNAVHCYTIVEARRSELALTEASQRGKDKSITN